MTIFLCTHAVMEYLHQIIIDCQSFIQSLLEIYGHTAMCGIAIPWTFANAVVCTKQYYFWKF